MNLFPKTWLILVTIACLNRCSVLLLPETKKATAPGASIISLTLPPELRIHDCLEARVFLAGLDGQPEAPPTPITVAITHTGDVDFYATLNDCAGNQNEISSVVLTPQVPERIVYFQTSQIQNLSIGVSHPSYGSSSGSGSSTFTRTGYNRVDGPGGDIFTMAYQPVSGRLVVGGKFVSWDDHSQNRIARLLADGSLDTSFTVGAGFDDSVNDIGFFPDGRVVVGGWFSNYAGSACPSVCVLNADGTVDTGFTSPANLPYVNAVAVQSDGKIVVGGGFNLGFGNVRSYIARLTSTGALDSAVNFSNANYFDNSVFALTIQSDGKILVGGEFTNFGATAINRAARLNTDGTLDVTFAPPSGANQRVRKFIERADGKIWVGGWFENFNGVAAHDFVAVINANGTSDAAALTEVPNFYVNAMAVQSDLKLVIAGAFTTVAGATRNRVARLNAVGTLDTSYLGTGDGVNKSILALAVAGDDRAVFAGEFGSFATSSRNRMFQLDTAGALTTSYKPRAALNAYGKSLAMQSDGKLLVGGEFTAHDGNTAIGMVRVDSAGNIDPTFSVGVGCYNSYIAGLFNSIAVLPNDTFLAAGSFTDCQSVPRGGIARFLKDGAVDPAFTTPGGGADHYIHSVVLQPDGKILIGGSFQNYGATARARVARLNADGSIDTSFNPGTGANNIVWDLNLLADGKILVSGDFTDFNSSGKGNLVRLNANGTVDNTLDTSAGFGGSVFDTAVYSDGKIIAVGNFAAAYGNAAYRGAVRLNTDGSLDTSFTPPSFGGWVSVVELLPDDSAVIGTHASESGGAGQKQLTLLKPDGVYDPQFVIEGAGGGLDAFVNRILIQPNGKIVATGEFSSTFKASFGYLLRLTRTGAID